MPQYQIVDFGPSPQQEAVTNFAKSFSESLKKARERDQESDLINQIINVSGQSDSRNVPNNITEVIEKTQSQNEPQINRLSPEKIAQINVINPKLTKHLEPIVKRNEMIAKESLKADMARSKEFLSKVDQIREGIPRKEMSLRQIDEAIASGTTLDTIRNQLADISHLESLRSAKGAQLRSATKEFFLSDLSSIPGVRANQFLEKALSSAMTDDTRTKEANEMLAAGMRSNLNLDIAKTQITSQVENEYRRTLGYIPADISSEVNKRLVPIAQNIQDKWANDVQHIQENHDSSIQKFIKNINNPIQRKETAKKIKLKKAIPGSELNETMGLILLEKYGDNEQKAFEAAKKLGYIIPGEE